MRKIYLLLIIISLTGCMAYLQMQDNLQALHGQHIDAALGTLGLPDGSFKINNTTVYAWGRIQSNSYTSPATADTHGYIGMTSYFATTHYSRPYTKISACTVKIAVNADNIIIYTEYDGDWLACDTYARRLYYTANKRF